MDSELKQKLDQQLPQAGQKGRRSKWSMAAKRSMVSFWSDQVVLKLIVTLQYHEWTRNTVMQMNTYFKPKNTEGVYYQTFYTFVYNQSCDMC